MAKRRSTTRRRRSTATYQPSRTSGNGALSLFFIIVGVFVLLYVLGKNATQPGQQRSITDIMTDVFPEFQIPSYNFGNVSSLFYHDWSNPDQSATYGVQYGMGTDWTQPSQPVTYGVNYQFNPYI